MAFHVQTHLAALLLLSAAVAAFDVKEILDPYPEFSTFTKHLADTKLVDEINSRQTITVLAVDNSAIGPISAVPAAQLKDALSVHVLLDYYDPYIFDRFPNKTALITTLFQASGKAADQNGFLNYTELPGERMVFGSAAPGAPHDSELLKVIGAKPYNLSVLQISKAIVPPGIGSASPAAAITPATTPAKAATPVPAPKASPATPAVAPPKLSGTTPTAAPPKPTNAPTPATAANAPKPSDAAPTNAPADGAKAPAKGPAVGAATPAEGPASSSSSGPTAADVPAGSVASPSATTEPADEPSSAGEATASSSARVVAGGATMGVVMAVAAIALL